MNTKLDYAQSVEKPGSPDTSTKVNGTDVQRNSTPPMCFNSKPLAHSSKYSDNQSNSPFLGNNSTKQHGAGASASTVAAVLGSEYVDLDAERRAERKKKTLRQRWNDFKKRNFLVYSISEDRAGAASAAEWNVQGGKPSGGLASPYRRTK